MDDEAKQSNISTESYDNMSVEELQNEYLEAHNRLQEENKRINELTRRLISKELDKVVPSRLVLESAKKMGPMDDIFFNKMSEREDAIAEVISTILGIKVDVLEVVPQYTLTGIKTRGVRLDSFSRVVPQALVKVRLDEDSPFGPKGGMINVEVQKDDDDDHEYRVYYNGASMIVNNTPKGIMFKDLPRAIVIFISSFDVFEHGRLYYEMRKYTEQDKIPGRSPVTEIYINAGATDDSTPKLERITKLMELFTNPDKYNFDDFPAFSKRKDELKNTEKGVMEVSKEFQRVIDGQVEETKITLIMNLMETMKLSAQEAMKSLKVPQKEWGDYEVKINGIMTPAK